MTAAQAIHRFVCDIQEIDRRRLALLLNRHEIDQKRQDLLQAREEKTTALRKLRAQEALASGATQPAPLMASA